MHAQQAELAGDPALIEETDRRVATLEDLFAKILRFAVVVALIIVILGCSTCGRCSRASASCSPR